MAAVPTIPGPDPSPTPPGFVPPPGACDCHAHVFGPQDRYPYVAGRTYTPPDCPLPAYRRMLDTLGLARCVLVQPSVYGADNRLMMACLDELGAAARGVAVMSPRATDAELEALHARGVRGLRLNLIYSGGGVGLGDAEALAARIAPLGWHLQFLVDVSATPDLRRRLARLPVPCVIDHMGHLPAAKGVRDAGFRDLLDALAEGRTWVKLSGAYRMTALADPPYDDVRPMAEALIAANPDRLVWGSDWPHPALHVPMPNDGTLLDLLAAWAPDALLRRRILVDNPARLYGFA
jgi:predicted TIM-barrel fold metal-dependent hydrolase